MLFSIYLLAIVLMLVPPFLGAGIGMLLLTVLPFGKGAVMAVCTGIGGVAGIAGSFWGMGALLSAALDDGLSIRSSFDAARATIASLFWVCLLTGFIVTGGFLLFIIPGIVFSVWFLMAPFVLADGDTRGMTALLKSRSLVTGRWFDVFLRMVILWGVSALIAAIPMLGPLLLLIATPYLVLCQAILFKDLKHTAGKMAHDWSPGERIRWPSVAAVGYVALPVVLVGVFGMSLLGKLQTAAVKSGLDIAAVRSGPDQPAAGDRAWRVIPIPGREGEQPAPVPPQPGGTPSVQISSPLPTDVQRDRTPDNIHVFIYAVNAPGRVLANGVELKQIEDTPDMQYNYNMSGDKLRYGRNTITVEYAPLTVTGNMLKPKIHLKISRSSGGQRQVLGDWHVEETVPGQKHFDLDVPDEPSRR